MNHQPVLIGLPLSATFVPALQKAIAALRHHHPKEKDAELLGRLLVTGIVTTLNTPEISKERIARRR